MIPMAKEGIALHKFKKLDECEAKKRMWNKSNAVRKKWKRKMFAE